MKTILKLIILSILLYSSTAEAQLLKKLKQKAAQATERAIMKKAEQKAEKMASNAFDSVANLPNKKGKNNKKRSKNETNQALPTVKEGKNTAKEINGEAKSAFYKEDIIIRSSENGGSQSEQFFDADEISLKMFSPNSPFPGFTDSEGFMYVSQDGSNYDKTSIVALQSQGLMGPMMLVEALKLPPEPYLAELRKQTDLGMTAFPFNGTVEFAFVYKPENFRYEDFAESKTSVDGKEYTRFDFLNEPGYEGSYVLFDDQDRLTTIYSKYSESQSSSKKEGIEAFEMNMRQPGENKIEFDYSEVNFKLPEAKEKRVAGQGLMEMVMGMGKGGGAPKGDIDEDDYDTSDSHGSIKGMKKAIKSHKVGKESLPNSYDFDWKYTLKADMQKQEPLNIIFLLKEGANYQGISADMEQMIDVGNGTMVFDFNLNSMVMFIETSDKKMLQTSPLMKAKDNSGKTPDFTIKELPPKTILGYECKGLEMETSKYVVQFYHTTDAPINMANFFNFSGSSNLNLPDIDPRLAEQLSNGLMMEMIYNDKKKSKNNVVFTAQSLENVSTTINTSDYEEFSFFGGAGMFKN